MLYGQTAVANEVKRHAVILVKKCLNIEPCEIFYFLGIRTYAKKQTPNNGFLKFVFSLQN